jgi:hypothetical protein
MLTNTDLSQRLRSRFAFAYQGIICELPIDRSHRQSLPEAKSTNLSTSQDVWPQSWGQVPGRSRILVRSLSVAGVSKGLANKTLLQAMSLILRRKKRSQLAAFLSRTKLARSLQIRRSCYLLFQVSMPLWEGVSNGIWHSGADEASKRSRSFHARLLC